MAVSRSVLDRARISPGLPRGRGSKGPVTTRHRRFPCGGGANMSRSRHQGNASSVVLLPVGARISVESPRAIDDHPSAWLRVGRAKTEVNNARTAG